MADAMLPLWSPVCYYRRHMAQCYQDSMAVVRAHGKPDLFLTVTCNPSWPEITRELKEKQCATDRPDLVARVFRLKCQEIMKDIRKNNVFGHCIADMSVIEFQKRGLPHAHILIILDPADKPLTPAEVDRLVCAEIPDPELSPRLYEIVTKNMLHGPCGAVNPSCVCMKDGACSKKFPKEFQAETFIGNDSFPKYRRCEGGFTYTK